MPDQVADDGPGKQTVALLQADGIDTSHMVVSVAFAIQSPFLSFSQLAQISLAPRSTSIPSF